MAKTTIKENRSPILDIATNYNKIRPRDIVLERRAKVAYYKFYERRTIREIAKIMKHSTKTIFTDLEWIKKNVKDKPIEINNAYILMDLTYRRNFNIQKLAELRQKLEDGGLSKGEISEAYAEIKTLTSMEGIMSNHITDMINLGFIDKPKDRVEVENVTYEFKIIKDEEKCKKDKLETKRKAVTSPRLSRRQRNK